MTRFGLREIALAAVLTVSAGAIAGAPAMAASDEAETTKSAPVSKPRISLPVSKTAPNGDSGVKTPSEPEENLDYMVGEELC